MSQINICTDGASLPTPLRGFIEFAYPKWVIEAVDDAGYLHDYWSIVMEDQDEARAEFEKDLINGGIKFNWRNPVVTASLPALRKTLVFGLKVYDKSPEKLQKILKKSTPKRRECKTIQVND